MGICEQIVGGAGGGSLFRIELKITDERLCRRKPNSVAAEVTRLKLEASLLTSAATTGV